MGFEPTPHGFLGPPLPAMEAGVLPLDDRPTEALYHSSFAVFDSVWFGAICEPFSLKLVGILQGVVAGLREKGVCGDAPQAVGLEQPVFGCRLGFHLAPFADVLRINSQLDQFWADHHKSVTL